MSSGYQDSNYSNNLDDLIGAVESLEDPAAFEQWNNSLYSNSVASDLLPNHVPCLATMRLLKKCLRTSRGGMSSCVPQLHDLEKCSANFYHDITRILPKKSCEAEMASYFSIEVKDAQSLKLAKQRWIDLYGCAKAVEKYVIASTVPKNQTF